MFRNGFIFRLIGALLLLGLVAGGAFMAYNAGVAQGIAQAPEVAVAIEKAAENGQVAPIPPMYGYGYGYGHPHGYAFGYRHHFNPFGAICFSFLFLFLFFGFMKMIFFRRMRHGWGHHGHWGKGWEGNVPPPFEEWHKRAHGEKPAEGNEESAKTEEK
ncbi:MAG: hypothetical protein IPG44_06680 [Anaerolineales bacterium]|jgi:hypothetical protein|nr:hypothetical protein [Anaerolineales bacterium]MCC6985185.1 hypothetical protein [Anaerolineales bacterium]